MNKRETVRYAISCPISLRGQLVEGGGVVVNVSPGGCRIRTPEPVQVGGYLRLILHSGRNGEVIKAELAFVRWAQNDEIGVEFVRINPEQRDKLRQLLYLISLGAVPRHLVATAMVPDSAYRGDESRDESEESLSERVPLLL
jgi:hypothetical protein